MPRHADRRFSLLAPLLVPFVLAAACAEEPTPVTLEGNRIELVVEPGLTACGGQLDAYDRFIDDTEEIWPGDLPGGFLVQAHAVPSSQCDDDGDVCIIDGTEEGEVELSISGRGADYRELARMVVEAKSGILGGAFAAGVPHVLGPPLPLALAPASLAGAMPDPLVTASDSLSDADLDLAAVFTRYLLERHGAVPTENFMLTTPDLGDVAALRAGYETSFGETFDEGWTSFVAESRCAYETWYCGGDDDVSVPFDLGADSFECSSEKVVGFSGGEFTPYRSVTFNTDEDRIYSLDVSGAEVHIARCGGCTRQVPVTTTTSSIGSLELPMGRHALIVIPTGGDVSVSLARM